MRGHHVFATGLTAAILVAAVPPTASANDAGAGRCWPEVTGCTAKPYEQKAAQAASRYAREELGESHPAGEWTVTCFPGSSTRKIDCSVHTRDEVPYDCVGGMTMKKIDGRWKARKLELSCQT